MLGVGGRAPAETPRPRAALLHGPARIGLDALALDDATSRDRDWGLRLLVVVATEEVDRASIGLPSLLPATEPFFDRPYRSVRDIAGPVLATIEDPMVRAAPMIGTPELWTDDVRVLVDHALRRRMAAAALTGSRDALA